MRRVLIAIAIVTVTALPSFADVGAQRPAPAGKMQQHPQMRQVLKRNPEHLLMMAYRKNLMTFGHILDNVARQGDTVPADLARTAVAEMRHSVDQIEKYRPAAQRAMPAEMQQPDRQKMMDQHLVDVKTHLRQLDDLSRGDRIPSQQVLKHLQPIFEGCQKMGCGGMPSQMCQGMQGEQKKGGFGCAQMQAMNDGCAGCRESMGMQAQGGGPAMQEMVQKMKHQDAEMASKVKRMQRAPKDKKVDIVAGIVAQLVQQRAEFTSHIEKMQHHMMQQHHSGMHRNCADCAAVPPPPPGTSMYRSGEGPDDEDVDTDDAVTDDVVGY